MVKCTELACRNLALGRSLIAWLLWVFAAYGLAGQPDRPNIIIILADDLGYNDVGFHGQAEILTPNLDTLAAESLQFSAGYCPASVCGPTRAALLSGFHNGHTYVDRNQNLDSGYREEDVFFTQSLNEAGYVVGAFGKWGFGTNANDVISSPGSLPPGKGVDEFYGYLSHKAAHSYRPPQLWRNDPQAANGIRAEAYNGDYSHDDITAEALSFIRNHAPGDEPFLLYLPLTIPHFDLDLIASMPGYFDAYAEIPGASSWGDKKKKYAAMIYRMDQSIGELIDVLEDPDGNPDTEDSIANNTVVIFSSDNGPTNEDGSNVNFFDSNGVYRGGKRDLFEGGIRVPLLIRWPGVVNAGIDERPVDLTDIAVTVADLAKAKMPVGVDGVSLAPMLTAEGRQKSKPYLIFEHHERDGPDADSKNPRWAIRRGDDKLIHYSDGSHRLFNLASDPSEQNPINDPALTGELAAIALSEEVERSDTYKVEYRNWSGTDGGDFMSPANWGVTDAPAENWSANLNSHLATAAAVELASSVEVLGLDVDGVTHRQTLKVLSGGSLSARNELRIGSLGTVHLEQADVWTNRWISVAAGGELLGYGNVVGDVYVDGGLHLEGTAPQAISQNNGQVDTGVIEALAFDFTDVQNDQPLTATSTLSQYLQITAGLTYRNGLMPGAASSDAGDEFNLLGFETNSLSNAFAADDYLTFKVRPLAGYEMTLDSVQFTFWRNGFNAATDYAIATSQQGFDANNALATLSIGDRNDTATHVISGEADSSVTTEEIEIRLAGWNAQNSGNSHFNAVSLSASFRSAEIPAAERMLRIEGTCYLESDAQLSLTLYGSEVAKEDYDQLVVTETLVVEGAELIVALGEAYIPVAGDAFSILDAGHYSGNFVFNLPPLPAGLAWETSELMTTGTLKVIEADGFSQWTEDFSLPVEQSGRGDDPEGDGLPNLIEYVTGGSASDPDSQPWAIQLSGGEQDQSFLSLRFIRPEGRGDVPISGVASGDLKNWSPVNVVITPQIDGDDLVEIIDTVPVQEASGKRRFLKFEAN